jgi:1,4-dihydroxy-2-naphthoate polyprenyltransferase
MTLPAGAANRVRIWCLAMRPRTLPAAVAPVLVGTAAAAGNGRLKPLPALSAMAGALLLQIAVNLANDYFDGCRGIDTNRRLGPVRATQSGLIAPAQVLGAMWLTLALASLCGLYLASVGGWPVVAIGLASMAGVLGYSGGPYPLASHGLGDLCVFLFFGPVAVCGTYYVQALTLTGTVVLWAIPPGLLITAILVVNNLRDRETDEETGKHTLAVKIGPRWTRLEFAALVLAAYALPPVLLASGAGTGPILLPLLTLPMGIHGIRRLYHERGAALNLRLGATAMLALWFSVLWSVGIAAS